MLQKTDRDNYPAQPLLQAVSEGLSKRKFLRNGLYYNEKACINVLICDGKYSIFWNGNQIVTELFTDIPTVTRPEDVGFLFRVY